MVPAVGLVVAAVTVVVNEVQPVELVRELITLFPFIVSFLSGEWVIDI